MIHFGCIMRTEHGWVIDSFPPPEMGAVIPRGMIEIETPVFVETKAHQGLEIQPRVCQQALDYYPAQREVEQVRKMVERYERQFPSQDSIHGERPENGPGSEDAESPTAKP